MAEMKMEDPIADGKLVELTYKVIDAKSNSVLTEVEYPIGYVHGLNEVLAPQVTSELEGKLTTRVKPNPFSLLVSMKKRSPLMAITPCVGVTLFFAWRS